MSNFHTMTESVRACDLHALLARAIGETHAQAACGIGTATPSGTGNAVSPPVARTARTATARQKSVPAAESVPRAPATLDAAKRAERFRHLADAMQKAINEKMNPATASQNHTRRRAGIIASMRQDGQRLEKVQCALRGLAGHLDAGTLPDDCKQFVSKSVIESTIVSGSSYYGAPVAKEAYAALVVATGCDDPHKHNPEAARASATRDLRTREKALALEKIPGYFPTPSRLADKMAKLLRIESGHRILEPSAGCGHLVDAVLKVIEDFRDGVEIDAMEYAPPLALLLREKYEKETRAQIDITRGDFLTAYSACVYDRIIMNPPFEVGQDVRHVRHAYDLLKPGGRLVAVMGEHAFFAMDGESRRFREWMDGVIASVEKLPEGTFLESDRSTGVNTRLIVIDKPGGKN